MLNNDLVRLRHILDAAREAVQFSVGRSREDLDTDRQFNLSLVRLLEIIGEAARAISLQFRAAYPELAWKKMTGLRDRLIHGYWDVDLDIVWGTLKEDLPVLIPELERLISRFEEPAP